MKISLLRSRWVWFRLLEMFKYIGLSAETERNGVEMEVETEEDGAKWSQPQAKVIPGVAAFTLRSERSQLRLIQPCQHPVQRLSSSLQWTPGLFKDFSLVPWMIVQINNGCVAFTCSALYSSSTQEWACAAAKHRNTDNRRLSKNLVFLSGAPTKIQFFN